MKLPHEHVEAMFIFKFDQLKGRRIFVFVFVLNLIFLC